MYRLYLNMYDFIFDYNCRFVGYLIHDNSLLPPDQRSWRGIYKWFPTVRPSDPPASLPEHNSKTVQDISTKLATHIKQET